MDESLSLQFIADRVVYMNADYIGREFTRAIGRKFSSYLLETRMEHAKLLMAGEPSMHSYEIAEKVGLGKNRIISASFSGNTPVKRPKTTDAGCRMNPPRSKIRYNFQRKSAGSSSVFYTFT